MLRRTTSAVPFLPMRKRSPQKIFCALLLALSFLGALSFPIFADILAEGETPSLDDIERAIPSEISPQLPENFSPDGIKELDASFFVSRAVGSLGNAVKSGAKLFAALLSIILITALLDAFRSSVGGNGEGVIRAFDLASTAAAMTCLYGVVWTQFEATRTLISSLSTFLSSVVPITGAMLMAGGGASSGAVSSANLLLVSAAAETVAGKALFPILSVCFALTVAANISKTPALSQISDMIRNMFGWVIGFLSALVVVVFSFQSKVAASADSVAVRGAKFAAGSFLPVVGGTVSESMRTVMGGFSLIKNTAGAFCIATILMLILPTLVMLFVTRFVLWLSGIAAKLAGTNRLSELFADTSRLINSTIAISLIFGMVGIFEFAIFIGIAIN